MLTLISRNTLLYTTLLNTNLQDHNTSKYCELIDLLFSEKNTEKISLLKHMNTFFGGSWHKIFSDGVHGQIHINLGVLDMKMFENHCSSHYPGLCHSYL